MTDIATAPVCATCGAENLGTNFCESCGAPATASAAAVDVAAPAATPALAAAFPPPPPPAPLSDPAHGVRAAALVTYLLGVFIIACIGFAAGGGAIVPSGAYTGVYSVTGALVGLFMLIAAVVGRAGPGGKAFGALLAIAYAITVIVQAVAPIPVYDQASQVALSIIAPALLFFSWGAGRPFRGPGYLAIFIVVPLAIGLQFVSPALGTGIAGYAALLAAVSMTDVALVITAAKGFDGALSKGRRVEPLTRASMALILACFPLNGIAGAIASIGLGAYVLIIGLLVVGIILGHAGFVRARRRGEAGGGLAIGALVIGYVVLVANVALIIWLATLLASFSSLLY